MNAINKDARLAGLLYLLMLPFAIFSLYIRFSTFIHDDPAATIANLSNNTVMINLGIVSWFIQQTISIFLVMALYKLLVDVKKGAALLMVVLVIAGVPIAFINELNQFAALLLVNNAVGEFSAEPALLPNLVMLFMNLHEYGTVVVHVFWGLWLFPLGYLIIKSPYIPNLMGLLLIIAGIGYLVDFATFLFIPGRAFTFTQITFIGELIFPIWLLIKGRKAIRFPSDSGVTTASA